LDNPRPFQATSALLLVVVQLLAALGVLLLGAAVSGGDRVGAVFLGAIPTVAPLVALYVGLVRYAPDEPTAAALRLQRPAGAWPLIGLALIFGAALSPVLLFLQEALLSLVPAEPLSPELENELRAAMERPATVAFLALSQIALAPLAHEALYRGFIQPRLVAGLGARRGVLIAAIFFAAAQLTPGLLPIALLVGLSLGVIALAAGTTWAPVAAHAAIGGTPFLAAALGMPFVEGESTTLGAPALLGGAAVAAAALALIWRLRVTSR
jgi:membrane protease YdiL (CAAX protease family)